LGSAETGSSSFSLSAAPTDGVLPPAQPK